MNEKIKGISIKNIVIFIILIFIAFVGGQIYHSVKTDDIIAQYEHNQKALNDTIRYYAGENGKLIGTKYAYKATMDNLEKLNEELKDKIKSLKAKNEIIGGANIGGVIENEKRDTTYIVQTDTIYRGFNHEFNFNNKWRQLEGNVIYNDGLVNLKVNKDVVNFDYTVGLDEDYNVYVHSDNPYVKYNKLNAFAIPKPKKTHFSVGPMVGAGYGIINNKFDVYVGVSVSWKLWEF